MKGYKERKGMSKKSGVGVFLRKLLVILGIIICLIIFAVFVSAAEKKQADRGVVKNTYEKILHEAEELLLGKDGAAVKVRRAVSTLENSSQSQAWDGQARRLFQEAAEIADKAITLVSPLVENANVPGKIKTYACWIMGNAKLYKVISTLRTLTAEGKFAQETYPGFSLKIEEIIQAYACALEGLATASVRSSIGAENADRFSEIIRKNMPLLQRQKKENLSQGQQQIDGQAEKGILRKFIDPRNNSQHIIIVPKQDPKDDKDPERKGYTPGAPRLH